MGKLRVFEIVFDKSKSVYYPSEQVKGKCVVDLNADMKMKSIRIFMEGIAEVHWTESESRDTENGTESETVYYDSEQKFFSGCQVLFGSDTGGNQAVLTEGRHEFHFSFQLPSREICTSFEGEYGRIRYWLKAEIVKAWSFNHKAKKAFTVIFPTDINRREYLVPVENNTEKVLCCWCCTSGSISLYAWTDRKGYCPGESIAITAEFENLSSRTIVPQAMLYQTQTFFAGGKSRTCTNRYTIVNGLAIQPGRTACWDAQLLKIPAVSPSITNCDIIRVDYVVRITLQIPGAINLRMDLPVIIGTVPLRSVNSHAMPSNVGMDTLSDLTAPPTYMECVGGSVDIADGDDKDVVGDTKFTPMYAYVHSYQNKPSTAYS